MNYIKQLTAAMIKFTEDDRLNPGHVSLYLALFQMWNLNRFRNPISINRAEAMRISKIGSRVTYHKCIRDLHNWSYLEYRPSHNPLKGSQVYMFNFETTSNQPLSQQEEQPPEQVLSPSINNTNSKNTSKQNKRMKPPTLEEIKSYLENELEAEKFFNYYTSNGWKVGGKSPMKNWKAAARNWMIKANELKTEKAHDQKRDNLNTSQNKDYHEPL